MIKSEDVNIIEGVTYIRCRKCGKFKKITKFKRNRNNINNICLDCKYPSRLKKRELKRIFGTYADKKGKIRIVYYLFLYKFLSSDTPYYLIITKAHAEEKIKEVKKQFEEQGIFNYYGVAFYWHRSVQFIIIIEDKVENIKPFKLKKKTYNWEKVYIKSDFFDSIVRKLKNGEIRLFKCIRKHFKKRGEKLILSYFENKRHYELIKEVKKKEEYVSEYENNDEYEDKEDNNEYEKDEENEIETKNDIDDNIC